MQNPALFLHKQVENILIFPLHIRKNRTIYASQLAIRCINLPECPGDRWPSDFCRMAIRLTHKWPSVPPPMAIHLPSDGHRTGWKHSASISPFDKPSSVAHYRRVDFPLFKSSVFRFPLSFNDLYRKYTSKLAYFQANSFSHGNTRFSHAEYTV